jgi:hypothetical protein
MKSATFILLLGLVGCSHSDLRESTQQIIELLPFGTPLALARQAMEQRQFNCSIVSYTNAAQARNQAEWNLWNTPVVKGGQRFAVTNVSVLRCTRTNCVVTFTVVNGETSGVAVKGSF